MEGRRNGRQSYFCAAEDKKSSRIRGCLHDALPSEKRPLYRINRQTNPHALLSEAEARRKADTSRDFRAIREQGRNLPLFSSFCIIRCCGGYTTFHRSLPESDDKSDNNTGSGTVQTNFCRHTTPSLLSTAVSYFPDLLFPAMP